MRYTFDQIEENSHMIKLNKWMGYPFKLFTNLLEYTCPELLKFKYRKHKGFAFFAEREFLFNNR